MKIPGGQKIKLIQPKTIKEKGIMICTPTHDGLPRRAMFACVKDVMRFISESGYRAMYSSELEGANLAANRIEGVNNAVEAGAHWVMFIDSDMTFEPDAVLRLVARDVDIVSGLCVKKAQPHAPTIYMENKEEGGFNHMLDFPLDEMVECDATGTAFLLIKIEVFKKMDTPYFAFPPQEKRDKPMGEDMYFCTKARELGYKIFVDTSVIIGHLGEYAYNIFNFLAIKEAAKQEAAGAKDKSGTKQTESRICADA